MKKSINELKQEISSLLFKRNDIVQYQADKEYYVIICLTHGAGKLKNKIIVCYSPVKEEGIMFNSNCAVFSKEYDEFITEFTIDQTLTSYFNMQRLSI